MLKKLYIYLIKLFIFYFFIIFIILFFLFILEFFWSKLNQIIEKGINLLIIIKLLFYFGISIIPLITPIVVLLTAIMIYGIFSESYEFIAAKSLGISFWRIMLPNLIITIMISIIIYLFADYIIPFTHKKIKNITYNITTMRYGINFPVNKFINYIPNIIIKIDNKISKNYLQGIYIKDNNNNQIILARNGLLIPYKKNNFFCLKLFDGTIYQSMNLNYKKKQYSYKIIKFDTLIQQLKIPILTDKIENLIITLNTKELINKINIIKIQQKQNYINHYFSLLTNKKFHLLYKNNLLKNKYKLFNLAKIALKNYFIENNKMKQKEKYLYKMQLELQRKFAFSITCIIMFFLGAPIGIMIKQGNIGLPVIITLIIFLIYYILITISGYLSENGIFSIIIGAWMANIIMLPIGFYLTYTTNNDTFKY